jgi:Ca2+-binding RTX toxin-like protein
VKGRGLRNVLRARGVSFALAAVACALALASPAGASLPKGDVVFIIDESGSMGEDIADARTHIKAIASATSRRIDARYALVAFGGASPGVPPNEPFTRTDFTTADGLARALGESGAYAGGGGGREMGLYATTYALTALTGFRDDAGTCAVLVSDEPPSFKVDLSSDLAEASAALARRNAVWFGIVPTSDDLVQRTYGPADGSLANVSGGAVFAIRAFRRDPSQVLAAVMSRCARSVAELASCTITGTSGGEVLRGTPRRDVICALGGDDVVFGAGGGDTVYGGTGGDWIEGRGGNDRLLGGPGADVVSGQSGGDRIAGGGGHDRLSGGIGPDVLAGEGGRDVLLGRRGNDVIRGGAADDVLVGHGGADVLLGNGGDDHLRARDRQRDLVRGGTGMDTGFVDVRLDLVRSVERRR